MSVLVTGVRFSAAPPLDIASGLLGWIEVQLGRAVWIEGVAVRRTRHGNLALSFPARTDRHGRKRSVVRLEAEARAEVERQVLEQLRREGRLAS